MSNILKISNNAKLNVTIRGMNGGSFSDDSNVEDQMQLQVHNAYERGYSDGYKKAVHELEQKVDEGIKAKNSELESFLISVDDKLKEYDNIFSEMVCELSFIVAEKIIKDTVENKPAINKTLNESMKKILGANNVIIKLNEKDLNNLNNENKSLLNDASYSKIKFEADESIETGGCLIETDIGNVDARVGTQLKELKKILDQNVLTNGPEDVN